MTKRWIILAVLAAAAALLIGLGRHAGGSESGQFQHIVDETVPLSEPETIASDTETGTVTFDASATETVDGEDHTVSVHVEAEEGAFPEGVTMSVETVDDPQVLESIRDAVEGETGEVHAVNITFTDESGEEVQPEDGYTVNVTLSSDTVEPDAGETEEAEIGNGEESDQDPSGKEPVDEQDGQESSDEAEQGGKEDTENRETQESEEQTEENSPPEQGTETEAPASELAVVQYTPDDDTAQTVETMEGTDPSGEEVSFESVPAPIYAIVEVIAQTEEEAAGEPGFESDGTAEPGESWPALPPDGLEEEEEAPPLLPVDTESQEPPEETVLTAEGEDYIISVICGPEAGIPAGAVLSVRELLPETEEYDDHYAQTQEVLDTEAETDAAGGSFTGPAQEARDPRFFGIHSMLAASPKSELVQEEKAAAPEIVFVRFFDITILDGDREVELTSSVNVSIEMKDRRSREEAQSLQDADNTQVIHFGEEPEVVDSNVSGNLVNFDAPGFSVFAVVGTTIEKTVLASDGHNYKVSVTCGPEAGIPEDASLEVREINRTSGQYEEYVTETAETLGVEKSSVSYARFFDITIVKNGKKLQPVNGSSVYVEIRLDDKQEETVPWVVHCDTVPQVLEAVTDGNTVSFETAGFSVYGIVDAPDPVPSSGWNKAATVEEIAEHGGGGFLVHHSSGYYFTNEQIEISKTRTGIRKTSPASATPDPALAQGAAYYYFEQVEGTTNRFKVWCCDDKKEKQYLRQTTNSLSLVPEENGSVFTIEPFPDKENTFRVMGSGGYYWNMQGGTGGKAFAAYNSATDANAQIQLEYYAFQANDPYGLDGKTYGIAYHDDSATASALTGEGNGTGSSVRLKGRDMLMRPDVLDNDGVLLVASNSDIQEWMFTCVREDQYQITTTINGEKKYLTLDGSSVTLTEEPDEEHSVFTAAPGTGQFSCKWHFSVNGTSLSFSGGAFVGAGGSGAATWMNLVERSVLSEDDFNLYAARKVSVSDPVNVQDGKEVILYTRIWNDTKKKYEFYAVDHDGSLVRCYDTGDGVEWIGSSVNTALWRFTEYRDTDGSENYYYELQNVQYGNYIAPQMTGRQVLSDSTVGINLNGRRYGENYSTIIAWDDSNYAYVGLKTEGKRVVACPLSEAEDFYFAVVDPIFAEDQLTTVRTIDSDQFGIKMRMIDFNNEIKSERDSVQNPFFGWNSNSVGLLTTDLDPESGYPSTTAATGEEQSLANLFRDMTDVNHLFIESIYNESGYFEYDSTQNFAHLNEDGTFTVYDQLGAIGTATGPTRTHGQFMPYNDIEEGKISTVTNRTTVTQAELPDTDPRKGEKMYLIPQVEADYFFGMEMEASFTQTASGLDAWGHDIIFEFSGDDDFWLYVDGELVLDLGGVHSAMTGSINFRTGAVKSTRGSSTLYEVFRENYKARGLNRDQIDKKLSEIFTRNDAGQYVFKDYTGHTMKMFYMERGAGASNLHMRFNLAAVRPGTVVLSKALSGTESPSNDLIEFPYQIWYRQKEDGGEPPHLLTEKDSGGSDTVTFQGSIRAVPYLESFTPAGGSVTYEHVFFLKAGETAVIDLPEDTVEYRIVECAVNLSVYDAVKANGTRLKGADTGDSARKDFAISWDTVENRSTVDYDNHVAEGAMRTLSLTKKLYDVDGKTLLHCDDADPKLVDKTAFSFRLYLGNENADPQDLPLADMYTYYVRDAGGCYCKWDAVQERFVSLDKTEFSRLTAAEKESARFTTSMNGSISKIPADYTVEVRDLIVGTQFKAEEREREIPKGYTLRLEDGYTRTDGGTEERNGTAPIADTIDVDESPAIEIRNQKGWGLTVEKVWTDQDFMEAHDPIYFAVYVRETDAGGETSYSLLDGSVRQMKTTETSLYYFFDNLQSGTPFENYTVFEVTVLPAGEPLQVDKNGFVTGCDSSTVHRLDAGDKLALGGKPVGGSYTDSGYVYEVFYEPGEQTTKNENVRTDRVTNSRPGIALYKTDWAGKPITGAVFTLVNKDGSDVAAPEYSSDQDGLITTAYLSRGTYTLTETSAPKGYVTLEEPVTITMEEDNTVSVSGPGESLSPAGDESGRMAAVIRIRNRPSALQVGKMDAETGDPIPGVHFALYLQVTDANGNKRKDYQPLTGYEDLVTDQNGILQTITMDLPARTYYLTETKAAEGYETLAEDLCFTLGTDGTATISDEAYADWLRSTDDDKSGQVSYAIWIPNGRTTKVEIRKISVGTDLPLEGASFALYRADAFDDGRGCPMESAEAVIQGRTGKDGILSLGALPQGQYRLIETEAPDGYNLPDGPIRVFVDTDQVTALQGGSQAKVSEPEDSGPWQITVWNTAGYELPASGGPGVGPYVALGALLLAFAGRMLVRRKDEFIAPRL